MAKQTSWMKDIPKNLPPKEKEYYILFNKIYYDHYWPTPKICEAIGSTMEVEVSKILAILNISLDKALELRKSGYTTENRQRSDAMSVADYKEPSQFERVTNRQRKKTSSFPEE